VHLVGFIAKKFVTMHGHMNVKKKRFLFVFEYLLFMYWFICLLEVTFLSNSTEQGILKTKTQSKLNLLLKINQWNCLLNGIFIK